MAKNNKDKTKLFTRIMAAVLAGMMVIAFAATLIYSLILA